MPAHPRKRGLGIRSRHVLMVALLSAFLICLIWCWCFVLIIWSVGQFLGGLWLFFIILVLQLLTVWIARWRNRYKRTTPGVSELRFQVTPIGWISPCASVPFCSLKRSESILFLKATYFVRSNLVHMKQVRLIARFVCNIWSHWPIIWNAIHLAPSTVGVPLHVNGLLIMIGTQKLYDSCFICES